MKQLLDSIKNRWKAFSPGQRMALLAAIGALVAGAYVVQSRSNQVEWAVLYANVDDVTASDAMAHLDARGLTYRLDGNGTRILVPAAELASTRLALAGEGVTGQAVPPGFEEVFSGQGLAASDFEQKVNYERALEGELARTLLTMDAVRGANVQLSLPDQSIFVGSGDAEQAPAAASVMLSLSRELSAAEVTTIANVISSSVEGLSIDNVTIASNDGKLLRAAGEDGSGSATGGSTKAMDVTSDFETALATRLTDLARTLTGSPGATVQVRAELDFTESTVENEVIDPDTAMTTAEQVLTETWSGSGSAAGGTAGVNGGAVSGTAGGDGTYQKDDRTTTFTPGNRTITKSTSSTPTLNRLSVAVVVPVTPDAKGKVTPVVPDATVQRVLASAAGLDTARGDTIEVASVPETATDDGNLIVDDGTEAAVPAEAGITAMLPGIGIGVGIMIVLGFFMRRRKNKKVVAASASPFGMPAAPVGKQSRKEKKVAAKSGASTAEPTIQMPIMPVADNDPDRLAVDEIRSDLERMLAESPESLAALLSSWMAK